MGTNIGWLYGLINKYGFKNIDPKILENLHKPLPVPSISIYSKDDCVVKSHACIQKGISKTGYKNIEVGGSHLGLPFNLKAYKAITSNISGLSLACSKTAIPNKVMAGGTSF